jgi:acyl dehydratase
MFDPHRLLALQFDEVVQGYSARDTMLYALGLGLGRDPLDALELRYVFEPELMALPTMAVVFGHPGPWGADPALGIDNPRVLHAAMEVILSCPLPATGRVRARESVVAFADKGQAKGALMVTERHIADATTGEALAVLRSTAMLRGNGGSGVVVGAIAAPHEMPVRAPDHSVQVATLPGQALLYRLSGDYNPLHADPALARSVGFERPILHGLCTFGMAITSLIRAWCEGDAQRLRRMAVRWTAPVMPGETLRIESWRDGSQLSFRVFVMERGVKAIDHGVAEFF